MCFGIQFLLDYHFLIILLIDEQFVLPYYDQLDALFDQVANLYKRLRMFYHSVHVHIFLHVQHHNLQYHL